ncbi:MAG: pyrroline-5-carboxylate reductase [Rhodanobacteraceae bacterium]
MENIGIVGLGTIGAAIAEGLHTAFPELQILGTRRQGTMPPYVTPCAGNRELLRRTRLVMFCIKPQHATAVLEDLRPELGAGHSLVSTCAGLDVETLRKPAGRAAVARAMPNLPCQIGEGVTALHFPAEWNGDARELVLRLFDAIGRTVVVEERHFDAVTALSGCGPAYIYTIIEALSDGGVKQGLPRDVAKLLAAQTVQGSAQLVLSTHLHPAELRDRVATPAGCTIDALARLEDGGLRSTLISAVAAAAERSAELTRIAANARAADPGPGSP